MAARKIRIAVAGLGFGASFAEIYREHPDVAAVGLCEKNPALQARFDMQRFPQRHSDFDEMISSGLYDAVHICLPATQHAEPTLAALRKGLHVACAVPMSHTIEDLQRIVETQKTTGLNYMMMETIIYGREYLFAKDLLREGRLGNIQFLRGCHSQDLEPLNPVWRGLPPMWYMTHAVAPLLDILDTQAVSTSCVGSGRMREELVAQYNNPYPIESAIFSLRGTPVKAEITRTLFETAPYGGEAFDIFGELGTYATIGRHAPQLVTISRLEATGAHRRITTADIHEVPYRHDLLPNELHRFARGGHGGSHPHLVNEFVRSIVEQREPYIHARRAANWCAPGICAHASAMKDGERVAIPAF